MRMPNIHDLHYIAERNLERIVKCIICICLIPFLWLVFAFCSVAILWCPIQALINPDSIKFNNKGIQWGGKNNAQKS